MEEAMTILEEVGREFGLGAELRQLMRHCRLVERLTGEGSGIGLVVDWLEAAANDLSALANGFSPASETALYFRNRADRMRAYSHQLRALGVVPMSPRLSHESPVEVSQK
jgi:hypothetical protein